MSPLALLWKRTYLLEVRHRTQLAYVVLFFVLLTSLIPLGLPTNTVSLPMLAPGIIWAATLLATILTLPQWFADDLADDSAAHELLHKGTLIEWVCIKWLCRWLCLSAPLSLSTLLVSLLWHLPLPALWVLVASIAIGTISLTGLASLVAAMTARAEQSTIIWPLLFLPLAVPILILGSSAATMTLSHQSALSPLLWLSAMAVFSMLLVPWTAALLLKWAIHYH